MAQWSSCPRGFLRRHRLCVGVHLVLVEDVPVEAPLSEIAHPGAALACCDANDDGQAPLDRPIIWSANE